MVEAEGKLRSLNSVTQSQKFLHKSDKAWVEIKKKILKAEGPDTKSLLIYLSSQDINWVEVN